MEIVAAVTAKDINTFEMWHKRMGHPAFKVVCSLHVVSVSSTYEALKKVCDVCLRAKHTRSCFPFSLNKTKKIFKMIHCNLWDPYRTESFSGARYFLTIVDDCSRGVWIYLLKDKTEAPTHLMNFLSMVTRKFQTHVQTVQSDNWSEFLCLTKHFLRNGIVHETSCVGTPQQNWWTPCEGNSIIPDSLNDDRLVWLLIWLFLMKLMIDDDEWMDRSQCGGWSSVLIDGETKHLYRSV